MKPHNKTPFQLIIGIGLPIVLYFLISNLSQQLILSGSISTLRLNPDISNFFFSKVDEVGKSVELTPNGMAIFSMVSSIITSIFLLIFSLGYAYIKRAEQKKMEMSIRELLLWIGFSVSLAIGWNALTGFIDLAKVSETYNEVAQKQYAINYIIGLIKYGLISVIVEEILLRGIIFNKLHAIMYTNMAAIFTGVVFGLFHGNIVQGLYAFVFGYIFSLAYAKARKFIVPILLHGIVNIVIYTISEFGLIKGRMMFGSVAVVCLTLCGIILAVIKKKKEIK